MAFEAGAHVLWMVRLFLDAGLSAAVYILLHYSDLSFPSAAEGSLMNSSSFSRKSSTVRNLGGFSVTLSSVEIPTRFRRFVTPP